MRMLYGLLIRRMKGGTDRFRNPAYMEMYATLSDQMRFLQCVYFLFNSRL